MGQSSAGISLRPQINTPFVCAPSAIDGRGSRNNVLAKSHQGGSGTRSQPEAQSEARLFKCANGPERSLPSLRECNGCRLEPPEHDLVENDSPRSVCLVTCNKTYFVCKGLYLGGVWEAAVLVDGRGHSQVLTTA